LAIGEVDHIIDKIVQKASQKVLGENMGALISQEQREFLISEIEMAQKQGAKILLDGTKFKAPVGKEKGFWLGPTILDQVQPGSRAATTELFGPVMSIIRCQNISQALQIENNNPYGNAASVFTTSGPLSERVVSQAQAGMVGVNVGVPVPREPFSFGGIGDSKFGHGDITGPGVLNFWSDLKKVTTKWSNQNDSNWMS